MDYSGLSSMASIGSDKATFSWGKACMMRVQVTSPG